MNEIAFREMASQGDADAFRTLNEEWIAKWFRLEEKDIATLSDPMGKIIAPGGHVYMAAEGDRVLGTGALIRFGDGIYELSKMAVSPDARGNGIGRKLILYILDQARALNAHTVFLGSSKKLENAVHLYESIGFRHVLPSELPEMKYARADVFMKMDV
jgi:GNAT superfamily N-acetyltransferase